MSFRVSTDVEPHRPRLENSHYRGNAGVPSIYLKGKKRKEA